MTNTINHGNDPHIGLHFMILLKAFMIYASVNLRIHEFYPLLYKFDHARSITSCLDTRNPGFERSLGWPKERHLSFCDVGFLPAAGIYDFGGQLCDLSASPSSAICVHTTFMDDQFERAMMIMMMMMMMMIMMMMHDPICMIQDA